VKRFLAQLLLMLAAGSVCAAASEPAAPISTLPFTFDAGQVFLPVAINGAPPETFVLDSGASGFVVDTEVARKHTLEIVGGRKGTGAGKGTYNLAYAAHVAFQLGDSVTVTPDSCYVIDLSGLPATLGRHVAGIVGYEFFARYVVDVDHDAQILRVYDNDSYRYTGDGSMLPLTFHKKVPYVTAAIKVNGRRSSIEEFMVDSGSGDAVDHDIIAQSRGKKLDVVGGVGLGQEYRVTLGRVESLRLGKYEIVDAVGVAGGKAMIGNQVLGRFRVIFDYRRTQMVLEPNSHYHDTFEVDASGIDLRLDTATGEFIVHDVHQGSPAEQAGIAPEDRIVKIDGEPAKRFSLTHVTRLFQTPDRRVNLTLRRGSTETVRAIVTKKQL
jgi:PDZ domain/Aspartyl protease